MTVELADLPRLSPEWGRFIHELVAGKSQTAAHEIGWPHSKTWTRNALWVEACRRAKNPKVLLWIAYLRRRTVKDLKVTRQSYINRLVELMNGAIEAGNHAAAVRCWELLGKVEGFYVERTRDETPRSPAELEAALREVRAKLAGQGGGLPTRH